MAKQNKSNNRWLIIIGAVAVLGLAFAGAKIFGLVGKEEQVSVTLDKTALRTIYARVTESGVIEPAIDVPVAPDVSGEVVTIAVQEGMDVKKGDLLITIQPDDYVSVLEQARASLNQAKANHLQAQARLSESKATLLQDSVSLARTRQLFEEKVLSQLDKENADLKFSVSKSQWVSAQYSVNAAFYQIKNAEASVRQAQQRLDRTNIYASMDGTITQLNVELGQRAVGTGQMAGTEILKIADLSKMEVVAEINENDIINVSLGDSAKVEVDAYPDRVFYGKVTEIAYSAALSGAQAADQVTNFEVKVGIDPLSYINENIETGDKKGRSPFRPGMTALVEIYTNSVNNVVAVPIQAVTLEKRPENDSANSEFKPREIVYRFEGGKAVAVPVEVGISDDEFIHIKAGLESDQTVITGPYTILTKELKDGMAVKEAEKDDKKKKSPWMRE
jgi:HlyD family secretion protein